MIAWRKVAVGLLGSLALLVPWGQVRAQQGCAGRLPAEPISLSLREASVQTTLRLLARQYRVNMVVTEEVQGSISVDFFQVPARDVFQAVIETAGMRCVEAGGVLRVSTAARFTQEEEERAKVEQARARAEAETRRKQLEARREEEDFAQLQARGPIREVTVRLSYADADEVARTLHGILGLPPEGVAPPPPLPAIYQPLAPTTIGAQAPAPATAPAPVAAPSAEALAKGLTVRAHRPTNSLFIRYYERDLERITRLIREELDVALPQVQIAAQMVISNQNALEQLGIQWGGAALRGSRGAGGPALVGSGFTAAPAEPGTGVAGGPGNNPNFTGATFLPVSPTTGLPVGGNIVNLPTAFLPTVANPALGLLFGIIGRDFNINLAIQALELQGKARSLAEPKVVTVENAKAVISRGFEVPFVSASQAGTNVQFKDALLQLQVTPNVIREEGATRIRMKVVVENNEPDFTRAVQGNPPLFKRRAETEVVVREGERLVIGGVMLENTTQSLRQVPFLGSLPLLGWLFKSREVNSEGQELIVIITPSVISPAGRAAAR